MVVGHQAIDRTGPEKFVDRLEACQAAGARAISENQFLELLGIREETDEPRQFSRDQVLSRSGLTTETFNILALFDIFEFAEAPLGFRGMLIAKQCADLINKGADWPALVRTIRSRSSTITKLTLDWADWKDVVARHGNAIVELSGQQLLFPDHPEEDELDGLIAAAEDAGQVGDWPTAVDLYQQCLTTAPKDSNIHFNLSHALIETEQWSSARHHLNVVLKLDRDCADAWYNLAIVAKKQNDAKSARRYLQNAIEIDPQYPDAIYNLALIHFDDNDHTNASKLWTRYLELDPGSEWSEKAKRGLQLIEMLEASNAG